MNLELSLKIEFQERGQKKKEKMKKYQRNKYQKILKNKMNIQE